MKYLNIGPQFQEDDGVDRANDVAVHWRKKEMIKMLNDSKLFSELSWNLAGSVRPTQGR